MYFLYKNGYRKVSTVQKCVHMYVNAKMKPVETTSGRGWRATKENVRGVEFMYDIFDTL
jgi:hypothetical protein